MSTAPNNYLFFDCPAPAAAAGTVPLVTFLKRLLGWRRRKSPGFALGQKVTWGTPPRTHTGKIIAVIPQPDADFPLLRIRYYDDPASFGHPVAVETELPAQLVRPVRR